MGGSHGSKQCGMFRPEGRGTTLARYWYDLGALLTWHWYDTDATPAQYQCHCNVNVRNKPGAKLSHDVCCAIAFAIVKQNCPPPPPPGCLSMCLCFSSSGGGISWGDNFVGNFRLYGRWRNLGESVGAGPHARGPAGLP